MSKQMAEASGGVDLKAEEREYVHSAVINAMGVADKDPLRAIEVLKRAAARDTTLSRAMFRMYSERWCYLLISEHIRTERRTMMRAMLGGYQQQTGDDDDGARRRRELFSIKALADGNAEIYLEFRLPIHGWPALRDATGAQIEEAAGVYTRQGTDQVKKGRWLQAVRKRVPATAKAADRISNAVAQKLFREHCGRDIELGEV